MSTDLWECDRAPGEKVLRQRTGPRTKAYKVSMLGDEEEEEPRGVSRAGKRPTFLSQRFVLKTVAFRNFLGDSRERSVW